ncbi:MAG: tripartite tricarboxylate transporter TctB family protein [Trueperaceae bacterium]
MEQQIQGRRPVAWGDLLVALGVVGLGAYFLQGAYRIRVLPSYSNIGPRFFPFLVAFALLACGAVLCVQALRGVRGIPEEAEDVDADAPTDWRALLVMGGALVVNLLLMRRGGFIVASTALYLGVALAFHERNWLRAVLIGAALSTAIYLAFTELLGLTLPAGIVPL